MFLFRKWQENYLTMKIKPVNRVYIFKYCDDSEFRTVTFAIPIPAISMIEAMNKFNSLVQRQVFIKEIKEETTYKVD